ncbi:MAG: hypothetical protein HRF50_15245 [Phycisphaerae bacterium]|jgi:hypothetical protein
MTTFPAQRGVLTGILLPVLAALALAQQGPQPEPARRPAPQRAQASRPAEGPEEAAARPPRPHAARGPRETHYIALQHAPATDVAEIVQAVFGGGDDVLRIAVDERRNAIVIAGAAGPLIGDLTELIGQLDQPPAEPAAASRKEATADVVESLPLKAADARNVVDSLHVLLESRGKGPPPVRICADERSRTIWFAGRPALVERCVQVARRMDESAVAASGEAEGPRELRFYRVERAAATPLANTIGNVLAVMRIDAGVVSDAQSNTLVAYATPKQHEQIALLVERLDAESHAVPRAGRERERGGGQ